MEKSNLIVGLLVFLAMFSGQMLSCARAEEAIVAESGTAIHPQVGYGVKYLKLEQSGAFGSGNGGVDFTSGPSIGVKVKHRRWIFSAGYERLSADFATEFSNRPAKETKTFQSLFLRASFDKFFLGTRMRTAPFALVTSGNLFWADVRALEVIAGLKLIKSLGEEDPAKTILLRAEMEGTLPVSTSATGGLEISRAAGFGLALKGAAEKTLFSRDLYHLSAGLELSASYTRTSFDGIWAGSIGAAERELRELGSRIYFEMKF